MNDLINRELHQVIQDWHEGKPVRSIALGHSTRLNAKTGEEERHVFRQKHALKYVFDLLQLALDHDQPMDFAVFQSLTDCAPRDLSAEERAAAESLAWKALSRGWRNALAGFQEHQYIELTQEHDA